MHETKDDVHVLNAPDNLMNSDIRNGELNIAVREDSLHPFVYWAQTESEIMLKVELREAKPPVVDFAPKSMRFVSKGYGACGFNKYKFELNFYSSVLDDKCFYRQSDNNVEFVIKKYEKGWWPRLVATPQKPHWLKIDFDLWRTEDDLLEETPRDIIGDYSKQYDILQKEEFGYIKESTKQVYLILYNLAQFIGFLYILIVLGVLYYRDGANAIPKAYESVGNAVKFCQLLQYLEVLHPIFGYTNGAALVPFFQISGRNFILFIMIDSEERMHTKPVVFYVFAIWAFVEVFRYPYYITQVLKKEVGLITWMRYTAWIPLYPMGIICEGIIVLRNLQYFEETKRMSVELPNAWNFSFDMPTFLKIYLFLLILPGTYFLMSHMTKTRAKKLGGKLTQNHFD